MIAKIESVADARKKIRQTVREHGPYWNQVVGFTLQIVDEKFGKAEANKLIRQCGLKALGWEEEPE